MELKVVSGKENFISSDFKLLRIFLIKCGKMSEVRAFNKTFCLSIIIESVIDTFYDDCSVYERCLNNFIIRLIK